MPNVSRNAGARTRGRKRPVRCSTSDRVFDGAAFTNAIANSQDREIFDQITASPYQPVTYPNGKDVDDLLSNSSINELTPIIVSKQGKEPIRKPKETANPVEADFTQKSKKVSRSAQVPLLAHQPCSNALSRPKIQSPAPAEPTNPKQVVLGILEKPAFVVIENKMHVKIGWEMGKKKIKGHWVYGRVERGKLHQFFQSGAPVGDKDIVYFSRASRCDHDAWLLEIKAAVSKAEMDGNPSDSQRRSTLQSPTTTTTTTTTTATISPDTAPQVAQDQHARLAREVLDLMTSGLDLTSTGTPSREFGQTPPDQSQVSDEMSSASEGLLIDVSTDSDMESTGGADSGIGLDGVNKQFDPFKWLLPASVFRI